MSKESLQWLNTNTLIGCTDKRGTAWHWRAQEQGDRSNHYPGAIPVADVQDRLFSWQAESRRLAVELPAAVVDATHWQGGAPSSAASSRHKDQHPRRAPAPQRRRAARPERKKRPSAPADRRSAGAWCQAVRAGSGWPRMAVRVFQVLRSSRPKSPVMRLFSPLRSARSPLTTPSWCS